MWRAHIGKHAHLHVLNPRVQYTQKITTMLNDVVGIHSIGVILQGKKV